MTDKFGFGIIGTGMAVEPHMLALQELGDQVAVRGVYTRSAQNREAFAKLSGFPAVSSLDQILNDQKIKAVLLLTPPNHRRELVAKLAGAGKHILMEKPVGRTLPEANELVSVCADAGVTLGIVFQHRFKTSSMAMKALIAKGTLGKLCSVALTVPLWRGQDYYDEPGRGTFARDGGGVMLTQAIHEMDLMLWLAGPVKSVQAMTGTTRHRMEAEDFVAAALAFENGALGSVMATVTAYPGYPERLMLTYEHATAHISQVCLHIDWVDGRSFAPVGDATEPRHKWFKAQISEFVDAVRAARPPMANGDNALPVHRMISAIEQSSKSGRRIFSEPG